MSARVDTAPPSRALPRGGNLFRNRRISVGFSQGLANIVPREAPSYMSFAYPKVNVSMRRYLPQVSPAEFTAELEEVGRPFRLEIGMHLSDDSRRRAPIIGGGEKRVLATFDVELEEVYRRDAKTGNNSAQTLRPYAEAALSAAVGATEKRARERACWH